MENREDKDQLLNQALEFAQQCLKRYGGFIPFAGAISNDGKGICIAADPREEISVEVGNEKVEHDEVREMLIKGLTRGAQKGEYRATFLCYNASVVDLHGKKMDVVAVNIEHIDGIALTVFLPYCKKLFGGYAFSEVVAQPAEQKIFVKMERENQGPSNTTTQS